MAAIRVARPRFAQPTPAPLKSRKNSIHPQPAERSRAIFAEIGKVLTHPRCMNCHPAGEHPLQGAVITEHRPVVWRGDTGNFGTPCGECHTEQNVTLREAATYKSIPGHPRWNVAPLSMAWEGKSLGDICRQLKDTARNGGPRPRAAAEHIARDDLVAWGWTPGPGRDPAPGTQEAAGQLCRPGSDSGRGVSGVAPPFPGRVQRHRRSDGGAPQTRDRDFVAAGVARITGVPVLPKHHAAKSGALHRARDTTARMSSQPRPELAYEFVKRFVLPLRFEDTKTALVRISRVRARRTPTRPFRNRGNPFFVSETHARCLKM